MTSYVANKPAPKLGDNPTVLCGLSERLDRIERMVDDLVRMVTPLFSNPAIRVAIGAAVTAQSMKVRQ
jgi:hypothetical protein